MKKLLKKIFFNDSLSIHHRAINLILVGTFIGGAISAIVSLFLGLKSEGSIISLGFLVIAIAMFIISNVTKKIIFEKLLILAASFVYFPIMFFYNGGIHSGMPLWMTLGLIMLFFSFDSVAVYILFPLNLAVDVVLVFFSYTHPEMMSSLSSDLAFYVDCATCIVLISGTLGGIIKYQYKCYEKQEKILLTEKEQVEYATKAKSQFLSNISHDIRTPMNAIVGYTEIAKNCIDDRKKLMDCFSKISIASEHLLKLVNDVVDMSTIENGKIIFEEDPCNITQLIGDITDMLKKEADEKQVTVYVNVGEFKDDVVSCDKLRVQQIFMNVLSNAIKFSNYGGAVHVSVKQLESEEGKVNCQVIIKDEGCGMTKKFQTHLYEPFEIESTYVVNGTNGTGLGLTIVKRLLDMMKGTISVESDIGKGTEVTITIPFDIPTLTEIVDDTDDGFDISGKKILIVDDNEMNREIASEILSSAGCIVDEARDGTFAIEKVRLSKPGDYDLILMDIQMPAMNGYEASKIIRAFPVKELASIPIVAMTANVFNEDRKLAIDSGMNAFMPKPVSVPKLKKVLEFILKDEIKKN